MMTREKVMAKIEKLLALSASSNIHEAEVAANHAQRLMLEYKIEQNEILLNSNKEEVKIEVDREDYSLGQAVPRLWQRNLIANIGSLNFCKILERGSKPITMIIIGTKEDRTTTMYLYEMLSRVINKLGDRAFHRKDNRNAFKEGATVGVISKMKAARKDFKEETAIVLFDKVQAAVDEFTKTTFPVLHQTKRPQKEITEAYYDGYQAGKKIEVDATKKTALGKETKVLEN